MGTASSWHGMLQRWASKPLKGRTASWTERRLVAWHQHTCLLVPPNLLGCKESSYKKIRREKKDLLSKIGRNGILRGTYRGCLEERERRRRRKMRKWMITLFYLTTFNLYLSTIIIFNFIYQQLSLLLPTLTREIKRFFLILRVF